MARPLANRTKTFCLPFSKVRHGAHRRRVHRPRGHRVVGACTKAVAGYRTGSERDPCHCATKGLCVDDPPAMATP